MKTIESVVIRGIDSPRKLRVAQNTFKWDGIMMRPGGSIGFGGHVGYSVNKILLTRVA